MATSIGNVLNEVQSTVANHGKNAVALWKVHERAIQAGRHEEKEFINAFLALLTRVMTIKKGTVPAERLVKFVGTYAASLESKQSGRFLPRLLLWICTGFDCRDKIVRFRTVQIASECVAHLGELDEDIFETLHESLVARLSDKEPTVRVPAAVALARLLGEDENDELLSTLLNRLDRDPAPEVRRAILLNLPLFSRVIPHVLQRTRDVDPLTRKLVYTSVLAKLEHPRRLTLAQRELTVRTGLGDREPGVRVAAARLVTRWFDLVQTEVMEQLSDVQLDDGKIMRAFLAFLALFDVVGPAVDTRAVATDAALAVFVTRPSLTDGFIFSPDYWKDLTPERAVLARVFMEDCLAGDDGSKKRGLNGLERLDAAQMPVVSAFALLLQDRYNLLLSALTALEDSSNAEKTAEDLEDALAQAETILSELLRMSMRLDYADESGRRRVFAVVKDMLTHARLLPGLIGPCLDVMLRIMDSERDLIRIIVEVIVDLRDEASEGSARSGRSASVQSRSGSRERSRSMRRPKTREDMSPAERARADATDMRCLALCIGMLERVHGTFEDNSTLEGVLADLIVPAVKRKESVMREKGLIALGLCCLIARKMAISSFQLFLSQVQAAPPNLKLKVLQIVLDLLIMYDTEFLGSDEDVVSTASNIITFLLQTLQNDDTAPIQAVICVGLAKLLLAGIITDRRVIISLLIAYVSPATSDNLELRQCLSYFFPVYYGASSENQRRVQSVFIKALDLVIRAHEELASDPDIDMVEQHMVSPLQFATMLIEWTDPQQRVEVQQPKTDKDRFVVLLYTEAYTNATSREAIESDVNVHGDLAIDILVAFYDEERTGE
ncbi:hypothetical protein FISHEDRAFT_33685 [Fistulina hepatica ATCC 64428]|uniref:Nuclear condensin complex subunit 3 C-terminal domain-containing protein n=1 Tax=Fistulina hepatica ATCC 64428 TaxID=1128425 RepID=A0A0D7ANX4_9AGAR|nr:hypothetical protein FISHEDRAFT_33685 [Fistulina hepatica ATCC 64428]